MSRNPSTLLADTLAVPRRCLDYDLEQWSRLVRQARAAELLGQLRARLDEVGMLTSAPAPARRHLDIAWRLSQRHRAALRWELGHLQSALAPLQVPVVLLKGAAYSMAGSHAAIGRVFGDVDILIPRQALDEAETRLVRAGWLPARLDAYDRRYYRQWMHELPPMEHRSRATVLDVHHTIVPPTTGIVPDAARLIARATPVADAELACFSVLAPEDMVVHSACNLFLGEFQQGLRDLFDLHMLLEEFSATDGFWIRLVDRALATGLARPVLDALEQSRERFATSISDEARESLRRSLGVRARRPLRTWMFERALRPDHPSCNGDGTALARWLAYARSHWLRMPPFLLLYHLTYKAVRRSAH